jgi:hypothetical protein
MIRPAPNSRSYSNVIMNNNFNDKKELVGVDSIRVGGDVQLASVVEHERLNEEGVYKRSFNLTLDDIKEVDSDDIINFDKRSFWRYYWDFVLNHNIFFYAFFLHSFVKPLFVRIVMFFTYVSVLFLMNAMTFTDEHINKIFENNDKQNYLFVFKEGFDKVVLSILLAEIPLTGFRLLMIPTKKIKREFNEYLISKNPEYISRG